MAVTSIWAISDRVDKVIDYVVNPEKTTEFAELHTIKGVLEYAEDDLKTEQREFVTFINCNEENAAEQFMDTKRLWRKTGGRLCYHGYMSFAEGEVDAQTAQKIGTELATNLWGDRFEVVVAVHNNTNHRHIHLCLNSVSFADGKKFYNTKEDYRRMRQEADRLCEKYGLSVIYEPKGQKVPYTARIAEREGKPTKFGQYRRDIDAAIKGSVTMSGFVKLMGELGYEVVTRGKYPRFREHGREKFHRFYKLGEDYTFEAINNRILAHYRRESPFTDTDEQPLPVYTTDTYTDLHILYCTYRFEIEHYQKYPYAQKYLHPLLREDLIKIEQIDKQTIFLGRTQIKTMKELTDYKDTIAAEMESLMSDRNDLRNKLKRQIRAEEPPTSLDATRAEIKALTDKIGAKRVEIKLCEGIAERSTKAVECLSFMSEQRQNQEKEKQPKERNYYR